MKPLVSEVTRDNEPDRDLNSEVFSAKTEDAPSEAVKPTVRPLDIELAKFNEPEKDLKNELFSARPDEEPRELLRFLARPFV